MNSIYAYTFFNILNKKGPKQKKRKNLSEKLETFPPLYEFDKICRVCFKKSNLQSIYSFRDERKGLIGVDISEKIMLCFDIDVQCEDNLPKNICNNCSTTILNVCDLKVLSKKNDEILREILRSNIKLECKENTLEQDGVDNSHLDTAVISSVGNSENEFATENNIKDEILDKNINVDNENLNNLIEEFNLYDGIKNENLNICPVCDIKLDNNLKNHLSIYHNKILVRRYKCYGCDETFHSRESRTLHEGLNCSVITSKTLYKCSICKEIAISREDFDEHLWVKHRGLSLKTGYESDSLNIPHAKRDNIVCEICGLTLKGCSYDKHISRHNNGAEWLKCDICPYKTTSRSCFKAHKFKHKGEKPFQCSECPYKTDYMDSLKVHKMRHTGERPYACPYCDYKAVNHSNLKKHKISHFDVKDHQCTICGNSYKLKKSLKEHIKIIHEHQKKFWCKSCRTKYIGEEAYNRHLNKKHTQIK